MKLGNTSPLYVHDCRRCKFLGSETLNTGRVDIYYCEQAGYIPTMILRFSNVPYDYQSLDVHHLMSLETESKNLNLMARYYQEMRFTESQVLHSL